MKSSIAAMVVAAEEFVAAQPDARRLDRPADHQRRGRPGDRRHGERLRLARGARRAARLLHRRRADLGRALGDMIKNGRRGTPQRQAARQRRAGPHRLSAAGEEPDPPASRRRSPSWSAIEWDRGNDYFPPTSWQVSNIHAGTGAGNVIPGEVVVDFNFRFCTESTPRVAARRGSHAVLRPPRPRLSSIDWTLGGEPFLTPPGELGDALADAIRARHRHRDRAVDDRRHLGRPLHREDLPAGDRVRPGQRDHPQDRRARRGGEPRAAEEHLPRARLETRWLGHDPDRARSSRADASCPKHAGVRSATAPATPSTRPPGSCCGRSACRSTRSMAAARRGVDAAAHREGARRWSRERIETPPARPPT